VSATCAVTAQAIVCDAARAAAAEYNSVTRYAGSERRFTEKTLKDKCLTICQVSCTAHNLQLRVTTSQVAVLLLFILPFTVSFFINGCFEADMDNRYKHFTCPPLSSTLYLSTCFRFRCFRRMPTTPPAATTSMEELWAVRLNCNASLRNCNIMLMHHRNCRWRYCVLLPSSHPSPSKP
jgi:hypothetical protein